MQACSDNVVRAGLTPKFKDVPALVGMLTYATGPVRVLSGSPVDAVTTAYTAPVPEFALQRMELAAGTAAYAPPPHTGAAIVVVVRGSMSAAARRGGESAMTTKLCAGQIWLQPADCTLQLTSEEGALLFRAHAAQV